MMLMFDFWIAEFCKLGSFCVADMVTSDVCVTYACMFVLEREQGVG